MKKILLFIITLASAQYLAIAQITQTASNKGYSTFIINSQPEANSVIRSQYLNEDWEAGSLETVDSSLISDVFFRYNLTYERFEMRFIIDPNTVKRVYSNGKVYIYTYFTEENKLDSGYFELLNEGETSLLVKYSIKKIPGRIGAFGHDTYHKVMTKYYIKFADSPAKEIKLRKNSIVASFPDNKDIITKYIRSKKLNLRFRKDIIQLLNYYDSL